MRGANPQAALELAVLREDALTDGESIVIACSGGPDSVALAATMKAAAHKRRWRLCIVHVNHGRRASADQDEAVVLHVASALALPVKCVKLTGAAGDEATLRDARYAALERIAGEIGAHAIATAHTAEDQTETILMALFRGTGTKGLTGIAARRQLQARFSLCRPLLRCNHAQLRRYCEIAALPYALDPTNEDLGYRRNAVRAALDGLRLSFPGLDRAVARAAYTLADELGGKPRAMLRRRVREVLDESGELMNVDFEHVEGVVRALERGRSGDFDMKADVVVAVRLGGVTVKKR